jgi:outer membrane receptor protein involved in Fe transport
MVAISAGRLAQVRARALFLAAFVSLPLGALAADLFSVGRFDIAAQPLQSAMVEFTAQSGVQVTSATELLQDKRSTDLRGEYTAYAALTQLLSGTDLGYRTVDSNTVAIVSLPMQQPVPDSNEALAGRVRENTAAPADSSDGGSEVDAELTEVTVTGSRIVRRGAAGPTPVTSVEASDLRVMAPTTLMAAINQMPQFVNNQTPETAGNVTSSNVGASYLNLRGLGVNRTLVLLDGRRIVSSTRRGPVDVSLLPESLLRSIEVTTGGGSAAYGSDAVSGVVNFLLDTEFTGVKAGLQGGITERGDNENLKASLAGGLALGERAHLIGSMEYYSSRLIPSITSRDWFAGWALVSNPLTGAGNPVRVLARDVHSRLFTYGGLITAGPLAGTTFLGNGQTGTLQPGTLVTANMQAGGGGEDTAEIGTMVPGLDRVSGFARVGYDLDGGHRVFLQALVGQSTTDFESPPAGMQLGTWAATIYRNNAYLPASFGAQMDAAGITSFRYGRAGDLDYGADKKVRHRNLLTSSTIGASGRLSGDWRYDAYYQYGRTNSRTTMFGALRLDRIYQAMDAVIDPVTGAIVCNSTLTFPGNGCVPMNTFGVGSPSPEAIAYVTHPRIDEVSRLQQHAADFTLQGEPFTTWAGPVAVAAGASYRRDAFTQRVYPVELHAGVDMPAADAMTGYRGLPAPYVGLPNIFERGMSSQADGSYDVWEVFGESLLPLAKNSFLAHSLELNTAVRYANYKGSGGIMAWKAGLDWAPVAGLRLRATRSRDVRAGTLSERFDEFRGPGGAIDPASGSNVPVTFGQISGGNPNVDPERADTLTFGAVYQPRWLPGFGLTFDLYDIDITDAIGQLTIQDIVNQCYAGVQALCEYVTRDSNGELQIVENLFINIAKATTRGMDIEVFYDRKIALFGGGPESIKLRLLANHMLENSTVARAGTPKIDRVGQTGLTAIGTPDSSPDWQLNASLSYSHGGFTIAAQERYISSGTLNATYTSADVDHNRVSAAFYTNLRASYGNALDNGMRYEIYGNVSNVFDRDPPLAPLLFGLLGSYPTNPGLFDTLGRRFTLGVNLRF